MPNSRDIDNKSVRAALPDSTKKVGKLTVNVYKTPSEDKGDMIETRETEDRGQVVSRQVIKDGKLLENASTSDAQQNGTHEKASKAAGLKEDEVVYTTPSLNAVEEEVNEELPDPLGEDQKLTEKTKEVKPKAKPAQGKKPDTSLSKIAKETTGMKAKDGDRDLQKDIEKNLEKADKITDLAAERQKRDDEIDRKNGIKNAAKLMNTIRMHMRHKKQYTPGPNSVSDKLRADHEVLRSKTKVEIQPHPPEVIDLSPEQEAYVQARFAAANKPKLDKASPVMSPAAETYYKDEHDPAQHDQDQKMEALLEEKMKRHLGQQPLQKAEGDDPMRNMRFEHSAQAKLKDFQSTAKPPREGPVPKSPKYKVLSAMESNAKTAKNAITGGHFSAILHLAPATLAGVGNVCSAASGGCKDACLNTAGMGGITKTGDQINPIQKARIRKTQKMAQDPGGFMDDLIHDIHQVRRHASAGGKMPVVRLNGTSDLAWEDFKAPQLGGKNVFEAFPDVQFYDYTKRPDRVMKNAHPNFHLTFSRSEKNEGMAKRLLAAGHNVAAVFGGKQLPPDYLGHPVISGDEHDLRFLDPKGGHVIGLTAKGEAKGDKSGFVVWGHKGDPASRPNEKIKTGRRAQYEAAAQAPDTTKKSEDLGKAWQAGGMNYRDLSEHTRRTKAGDRDSARAIIAHTDAIKRGEDKNRTSNDLSYGETHARRHAENLLAKPELKLAKAKVEQFQSPKQKRLIRDERRQQPGDPMAKPRPELSRLKKEDTEWTKGHQYTQEAKPEHQNPAVNQKRKRAKAEPSLDYSKINKITQGKEGPALNYGEINKIKAKPASEPIEYHKMAAPEKDPRWKRELDAKRAGIVGAPKTSSGSLRLNGKKLGKSDSMTTDLKKDGYSSMAAGMKGAFGTPAPAPTPPPAPSPSPSLGSAITAGVGKMMGKAAPMAKDDKPHAPNSPEAAAHNVAEYGSNMEAELKHLSTHEKMSKMLSHLRTLKDSKNHRSPENAEAGHMPKKPLGKTDSGKWPVPGLVPPKRDNAMRKAGEVPPPPPAPSNEEGFVPAVDATPVCGTNAKMSKAVGAPAAPATPAKTPTPTLAVKKPKTPKLPGIPSMPMNLATSGATGAAAVSKSEPLKKDYEEGEAHRKSVGGNKTSAHKQRLQDEKDMHESDHEREQRGLVKPLDKSAPKGVSEEKYKHCKEEVAAKQHGSETKPYNVYAVCASSLKKAADCMRKYSNGGPEALQKDVVDLKTKKVVEPTKGQVRAQPKQAKSVGDPAHMRAKMAASKPTGHELANPRMTPSQKLWGQSKNPDAAPARSVPKSAQVNAQGQVIPLGTKEYHEGHEPAAPKKEGYDFEAAKKRYHEIKAKQAESIKNQDVKGIVRSDKRRW